MRIVKHIATFALLFCALNAIRCTSTPVAGGTSTSENGRVTGMILDSGGRPAVNTIVALRPADFDPVRTADTFPVDITDSTGRYLFDNVDEGLYSISGMQTVLRTQSFSTGIRVDNDTPAVDNDTLRTPGTVRIALPDSIDTATGYLYIPGTGIAVPVAPDTRFATLPSVPAGIIPSVTYASSSTSSAVILEENVMVPSSDTAQIVTTGWKYHRLLHLNTTASGADISEDIRDFPVLVRLSQNNFTFSEAAAGGSDIYFTKPDGTALSHETERWDESGKHAELWVLLDTIRGNDTTDIIMYWGSSRTVPAGGAGEVFDTAAGYSGVWHLSETGGILHDATNNRYHGFRRGTVTARAGIIGTCQQLSDSVSWIDIGNVLDAGTGSMTASAWVKRTGSGLQTIFSKSNGGPPDSAYGWTFSFGQESQLQYFVADKNVVWGDTGSFHFWEQDSVTVTDSSLWHYVVAVFDRSSAAQCRMYVDGKDVTGAFGGDLAAIGPLYNSLSLRIGIEDDADYPLKGYIDEPVIAHTVRSASWIRLCFANQRADDRLVTFE